MLPLNLEGQACCGHSRAEVWRRGQAAGAAVPLFQAFLTKIWWGDMASGTPILRLLGAFLCPALAYTNLITFRSVRTERLRGGPWASVGLVAARPRRRPPPHPASVWAPPRTSPNRVPSQCVQHFLCWLGAWDQVGGLWVPFPRP